MAARSLFRKFSCFPTALRVVFALCLRLQTYFRYSFRAQLHNCALAVATGLLAVGRSVENIQQLFSVFSGFIQQGKSSGYRILDGAQVASTIMVPLYLPLPELLSFCSSFFSASEITISLISARISGVRRFRKCAMEDRSKGGIAILPLNQAGPQCQLKKLGHLACTRWEQIRILCFDLIQWDYLIYYKA